MANTTVQTAAPDEMRGRIMSVYTTVFTGTAPFGALIASSIANRFGTPSSVMVGGMVTVLAVIAVLLTGGAKLAVRDPRQARKSGVWGTGGSVRVDLGGRR